MPTTDPPRWATTATVTVLVAVEASVVVFVDATPAQHLAAAVTGAGPLVAVFAALDADRAGLWRFAVVFSGSLVGLTLLLEVTWAHSARDPVLGGVGAVEFAASLNPVMAVVVGGATALAYYGVFQWGDGRGDPA